MVRTCDKCGKANQPTRKYCIRCGSSLIKAAPPKEKASLPEAPTPAVPETPAPSPPVTKATPTEDTWVKPSSVSRDRVRTAGGLTRPKSEFEKAKEAFAKAETVGIDEADGSGIVETRMLRASEVRELLEGPGMMAGGEEVPQPRMMEGSEPLPPEAAHLIPPSRPTSKQLEESILGSKSGYVDHSHKPEPEPIVTPTEGVESVSPELSTEFSSSRYEMENGVPVLEAITAPEVSEPVATPFAPVDKPVSAAAPADSGLDLVIACPDCGKVISIDMFEYPAEVYSGMGEARLKQARYFVVQGNNDDAMKAVRKARSLYEKADDKKGLKDVLKLVESLARGS
jgi:hypothetical protein